MTPRSPTLILLSIIIDLFGNNPIMVVLSKPMAADVFINAPINIEGENEVTGGIKSDVGLSIGGDVVNKDPIHLPEKHLPEITFPRKTLGRNYIIPNIHFPERAFSRNYISLNIHLPEITFS